MSSGVLQKETAEVSSENGESSEFYSKTEEILENTNADGLSEIRKILVQAEEVGEVLPSALQKRSKKDKKLAEATLPIVEENIRQSVMRDPKILAEALFPVIGPAIRKAIAEALGAMVQSFNQTLEQSVSPKGLRWRIEAWQTGKPFGEVVMLNTLLYRVEQIFLIHKKTGILLQYAAIDSEENKDADMVSAMLTAIQDFVHDSFKASEDATLDALRVRDLSVWIEHSPDAILAAVIRGNAPLTLRKTFIEAIERVQFQYENELDDFQGETETFKPSKPILQECLQVQTGTEEDAKRKKIFTPFNVLAGSLALILLIGGFFYVRDYRRWSNYLERLKSEPGIVVTEENRGIFQHKIEGLRDEMAANPETLLADYGYESDDVKSVWKNYQDLNPQFVLERAKKILNPPPTIRLSLEDGVLTVHGTAENSWYLDARNIAKGMAGISKFKVERE
ncbi:MAG TPA: hypothetical protein PKY59_21695 [Pyrinomonadaceae bacterium]|nr:hypothetical protein [Pyrinomonadaceae bacterium]